MEAATVIIWATTYAVAGVTFSIWHYRNDHTLRQCDASVVGFVSMLGVLFWPMLLAFELAGRVIKKRVH